MNTIRYVCISDLHLGASYSLLTNCDIDGNFALNGQRSKILEALASGIRSYFSPKLLDQNNLPQLIIVGDCFEFAFSPAKQIISTFQQFLQVLFPEDLPPLFAPEILFIPGNHDHHLWESIKDELFIEKNLKNTFNYRENAEDYEVISHMTTPLKMPSNLLNTIIKATQGIDKNISINACYPNYKLPSTPQSPPDKMVLLHHGHFIEPIYRLMTSINDLFLKEHDELVRHNKGSTSLEIAKLERQNGSWIDFLWSSFGRSGASGETALKLFDALENPALAQQQAHSLANIINNYLMEEYAISPAFELEPSYQLKLNNMIKGILDIVAVKPAESERSSKNQLLSISNIDNLKWYLSDIIKQQVNVESESSRLSTTIHDNVSFIFGHTHKPFEDQLTINGYSKPVNIFNSGGWTVEGMRSSPTQGAALILVDEQLNTASLRLFNHPLDIDASDGKVNDVKVMGVYGEDDETNNFIKKLKRELKQSDWDAFKKAVLEGISIRLQNQASEIDTLSQLTYDQEVDNENIS